MAPLQRKAHNLRYWLESAMCDMADGNVNQAERYMEDADVVADMLGDHIFDECKGDTARMIELASEALKSAWAGGAYYKALQTLSDKWQQRMAKENA